MSNIQPATGFVGFFDILGYTQIMLNNNIHKTAQFVSDTLMNIPQDMIDSLRSSYLLVQPQDGQTTPSETDSLSHILDKVSWIIFSDSILISLPFDPALPERDLVQNYLAFSIVCASLMNRCFSAGFPLRGAISVGEFFIEDRCFAGKPIINAFYAMQQLEFAGCVLDEAANNLISDWRKHLVKTGERVMLDKLDQTTIIYLTPLTENSDERHRTINWVEPETPGISPISGDIRDATTRAFLMHNKIAVPSVQGKINNTEMFIRHVLTNLKRETSEM
ncbi:MAG: hypothetical protein VB026_01355 [Anaerolineaceae bacterium]|nr:hypothetical protein [Anaerolineaceae bacterium]